MSTKTKPAFGANKYKFWVGTLNNYSEEELCDLKEFVDTKTVYSCVGKEKGAEGTPHLQAFFALKERNRHSALRKLLGLRWFLEPAKGDAKQAADYCKKEGEFCETGDFSACNTCGARGAGKIKADYAAIVSLAKKRKFDEIPENMLLRHYSAIRAIAKDFPEPVGDVDFVTGKWYYGPPGSGKSSTARRQYPGLFYDKPCNKWWDGYQNQDVVIVDDFDKNHKVLGTFVKRWTDRYSFPAEMKGTTVQIRPLVVIITSNYTPEEIWEDDEATAAAVRRRCEFVHFSGDHPYRPSEVKPVPLPPRHRQLVVSDEPDELVSAGLAELPPDAQAIEDEYDNITLTQLFANEEL